MTKHKKKNNGAPLYKTDLYVPKYNAMDSGPWRIKTLPIGFDHGYTTGTWVIRDMPVLLRKNEDNGGSWETWMSISPHEIESQELCCQYAHGNTVIMGLGMGWVAVNTAFKKDVRKVIIIEQDPEIIDLFQKSCDIEDLPLEITGKIEIIHADAFTWSPGDMKVNFMYIDIWKDLAEPNTLDDVGRIQKNIKAESIYYWGQEITLYSIVCNPNSEPDSEPDSESGSEPESESDHKPESYIVEITTEQIHELAIRIGLPLLIPDDIDYPAMILKAAYQRIKRKLPL